MGLITDDHVQRAALLATAAYRQGMAVGNDGVAISQYRGATWVAIAGTNDLMDWLSNLDTWKIEACGGYVHRGIWESAASILAAIRSQLDDAGMVYLVGHSRGGAIAAALKLQLAIQTDLVVRCVTFGAPQWCDSGVLPVWRSHQLAAGTLQVQSRGDIIHRLPWRYRGWTHVPETLLLGDRRSDLNLVKVIQGLRKKGVADLTLAAYHQLRDAHTMAHYRFLCGSRVAAVADEA